MSEVASEDQETAKQEGLSFQMTLCFWGWAVVFTLACGFILIGERLSLMAGFGLMTVGNYFSLSMPSEDKAGRLKPNHAWTEPVTKRYLMLVLVVIAAFVGLVVALGRWIPASPQTEERAIYIVSHPLIVVPFWAWMIGFMFLRWRHAVNGRK